MKNYIVIIALPFALALYSGCSEDNDLKSSVLIYDDEYTDLPAYSEWGYNTFGAYYDRQVFISNDYAVPAKVIIENDTFMFQLTGHLDYSYYYGSNELSLRFYLPVAIPSQYSDLVNLDKQTFDLKDSGCMVVLKDQTSSDTLKILSGGLQFKRAQSLLVDKKLTEVILSGYFSFNFLLNNDPISISEGRFDVGIGNDNFFSY